MALLWPVFLVSAAVLGFEISLLRILLVASWHHFAFLVISVALLGFGASGTVLAVARSFLIPRSTAAVFWLTLATTLSMPICCAAAQGIPVESRFVPVLFWGQMAQWVLFWIILGVPFFLGASAIGLALMVAHERLPRIYAANLVGSGAGALLAPTVMEFVPPEWLPTAWAAPALAAAFLLAFGAVRTRVGSIVVAVIVVSVWGVARPPEIRCDSYKYGAYVQRLVDQGSAERLGEAAYGPRGVVEIYSGDVFHDVPFVSGEVAPPRAQALVIDGHRAGSILVVRAPADARVVDGTLMSVPYALVPPSPKVLLLGERSGVNVWLAVRRGAESIHVVQPDSNVFAILRRSGSAGEAVLGSPGVKAVVMEPRHFVERSREQFDVVQVAELESSAAGSGGIGGMAQDFVTTVEGFASCLRRLSPNGILAVTRGIQTPPRDNVKLLATVVRSLEELGRESPDRFIAIVRDYLAVCTMVKVTPWTSAEVATLRQLVSARGLTPVWFPGIESAELNHPDQLPGPPNGIGDWYHHCAVRLFSGEARRFIDSWPFDVRPTTDDRPFFLDFCKLGSIGQLKKVFGDIWYTRLEIAFLFVLGSLLAAGVIGFALTVVPLVFLRDVRRQPGKFLTAGYFIAIGLAYLLLEMMVLSRLTLLIGDPVHAASATIATFLVVSGLGSAVAGRRRGDGGTTLRRAVFAIAIVGLAETMLLDDLVVVTSGLPLAGRLVVAIVVAAPLAFPMGFALPLALERLDRAAPPLVPWAWGVNGFASVVAAPLARSLAMSWGFWVAGCVAVLLYVVAGSIFALLPNASRADS